MELAAVVMLPTMSEPAAANSNCAERRSFYSSSLPILGNALLNPWSERVRKLGVRNLWLTSHSEEDGVLLSGLSRLAKQGIERLLLIQLKSYAEIDLADLLRFHRETRSHLTEAHDAKGQLGVSLIDRNDLNGIEKKMDPAFATQQGTPYSFRGYAKRILSASERQELVSDGLTGVCAMKPVGTQWTEDVWIGSGASIAETARVIGPAYIGARTVIRSGATVGPFASIEHGCVVETGVTVERATVLPRTYLAPGILIRGAVLNGGYLEDLATAAVVDLRPARLTRHMERPNISFLSNSGADQLFDFPVSSESYSSKSWREVKLD